MKYKILLSYKENTKLIELEEQSRFVRSVLEAVGIDIDFWHQDDLLTIEIKSKLKQFLNNLDIFLNDSHDGNLKIYHEKNLIAEWKKPTYVLKTDYSQIDKNKKIYLEMTTDFNSIFDEVHE